MKVAAGPFLELVKLDSQGLVPVVVQDAGTGSVRMVAWASREAIEKTAATGMATFWSRSRKSLWTKGETSGNVLRMREMRLDCDGDTLLFVVDAQGPSCHTGATSCFYRAATAEGPLQTDDGPGDPPAAILERLAEVIAKRRRERPEKSYVVSLFDGGWDRILGKIREESAELAAALPAGDKGHTAHEAADLVFHVMVALEAAGVPAADVWRELGRRFGISGLDEKASRGKSG